MFQTKVVEYSNSFNYGSKESEGLKRVELKLRGERE